jgi:hypothetical protein
MEIFILSPLCGQRDSFHPLQTDCSILVFLNLEVRVDGGIFCRIDFCMPALSRLDRGGGSRGWSRLPEDSPASGEK